MASHSARFIGLVSALFATLAICSAASAAQFILPALPTLDLPAASAIVPATPENPAITVAVVPPITIAPATLAIPVMAQTIVPPADAGFSDGLFGRHIITTTAAGPFPRWQKVIDRFAAQRANPSEFCDAATAEICPPAVWKKLVEELTTLPLGLRVARVNDFFNHVRYVRAETNWGDVAYWATPYEFLVHGGQCQDYAIAKYLALRESGTPADALRFVVLHDALTGMDHAITVVSVDGQAMALDNQMIGVTPVSNLTMRYAPYYALNDGAWWPYEMPAAPIVTLSTQPTAVSFSGTFQVARF